VKRTLLSVPVAILAAALCVTPSANATHGYFSYGYSTKSKGMGGTTVALPEDSLVASVNPAGMAFVGNRMDAGLGVFAMRPKYTITGERHAPPAFSLYPESQKSEKFSFPPHLGYNKVMADGSTLGISIITNGGANTSYPDDASGGTGTFYGGETGVRLEQLFFLPTYAKMVDSKSAMGMSALIAYQRFEARGLNHFGAFVADGNPDRLSDNGIDNATGLGWKFGYLTKLTPNLSFGASYATRVKMERVTKYEDLLAQKGRFDVPPTGTLGLAFKPSAKSVIGFEVQKIWYSQVAAISNPFGNLLEGTHDGDPSKLLGGENGPGMGWNDVTAYKLGYQWEASRKMTYRTGVTYGKQPVKNSEMLFSLIAPAIQDLHLSAGFTRKMGGTSEISGALVFAPNKTVSGPNPLDPTQTITLKNHEFGAEVSWGKSF